MRECPECGAPTVNGACIVKGCDGHVVTATNASDGETDTTADTEQEV